MLFGSDGGELSVTLDSGLFLGLCGEHLSVILMFSLDLLSQNPFAE